MLKAGSGRPEAAVRGALVEDCRRLAVRGWIAAFVPLTVARTKPPGFKRSRW